MVLASVASVALLALKHISANAKILNMSVTEISVVDEALNAKKLAKNKEAAAITSLLSELKALATREGEIKQSLKELGYKPTRKPRAKKAAAPVPAVATTE